MNRPVRFTVAASVAAIFGVVLYACSDDPEGGGSPNFPDSGGSTGNDSATGTDTSTTPGNDAGAQDATTDTKQPPKSCPFLEGDAGNKPEYGQKPCEQCAAANCCEPITKCYGGAPADAGLDGSDGTKTICMLYKECEEACVASGGGLVCEAQCVTTYGQGAQEQYAAAEECVWERAEPAGCKATCQD